MTVNPYLFPMEHALRSLASLILFLPGVILWHRVFLSFKVSGFSAFILGLTVSIAAVLIVIFLSAVVNIPIVFLTITIALVINNLLAMIFEHFKRYNPKQL